MTGFVIQAIGGAETRPYKLPDKILALSTLLAGLIFIFAGGSAVARECGPYNKALAEAKTGRKKT